MARSGLKLALAGLVAATLALAPNASWARGHGGGGGFHGGGFHGGGFRGGGFGGGGFRGGGGGYRGGAVYRGGSGYYGNRGYYGGSGYYGGYYPGYYGGNGLGYGLLGYGLGYGMGYNRGYYGGYGGYGGNGYGGSPYAGSSYGGSNYNYAPQVVSTGGPISIEYPSGLGPLVNYSLNGNPYSIRPGQSQNFVNDRNWIVEFDRGSGFGPARYTLHDGHFKFKQTNYGWELVRATTMSAAERPPQPML